MHSCAGMPESARRKQGNSLDENREFRRFFQGKVLDKKQIPSIILMTSSWMAWLFSAATT